MNYLMRNHWRDHPRAKAGHPRTFEVEFEAPPQALGLSSVARLALVASAVVATIAPSIYAQSEADLTARRGLLEQAQLARRSGDHAGALDLGLRAGHISMTASVRRFIAEEENALGRIAEALGSAEQCVLDGANEPPSHNRDVVVAGCRALATLLHPRVGRLVVRPPSPAPPSLRITLDGQPLGDAFWGVPYRVTPGSIVVDAVAPGFAELRTTVTVHRGAEVRVDVALRPEPVVASAQPPLQPSSSPPTTAAPTTGSLQVTLSTPNGSVPASATITLDGVRLTGSPPQMNDVSPGSHTLVVSAEGFQPSRVNVPVVAGQAQTIVVDLVRVESAPACIAGQAVTADTLGHCCWVNQAWSQVQQRCVGVPMCPSGLSAQAESCVALRATPATVVTPPPAAPMTAVTPTPPPPRGPRPLFHLGTVGFVVGVIAAGLGAANYAFNRSILSHDEISCLATPSASCDFGAIWTGEDIGLVLAAMGSAAVIYGIMSWVLVPNRASRGWRPLRGLGFGALSASVFMAGAASSALLTSARAHDEWQAMDHSAANAQARASGITLDQWSQGLFVATGVLLAAGVALFAIGGNEPAHAPAVTAFVTPGGTVGVAGRF